MIPFWHAYLMGAVMIISGALAWRFSEPLTGARVHANAVTPAGVVIVVMTAFFQFVR